MKITNRIQRLKKLREDALVTNHARQAKIEIAYGEALYQAYEESEANPVLLKILSIDLNEARTKLNRAQGRLFVGTVDTGGVWKQQLAYLEVDQQTGSVIFKIENMPGGWTLSQVINKDQVTFDGGTGWTARIEPQIWDRCREAVSKLHELGALIS